MLENEWLAWLILLLPLAAFVVVGLLGRKLPEGGGHVVVGAIAGSFLISLYSLFQVLQEGALGEAVFHRIVGYVWLPIPDLDTEIAISLQLDNLSALMLVLVSFLSMLIAIYSLGYMREEEGKPRYYAEISLFVAGMLGTVSADNFLQLLIFWEIMGLCSYLLIGFWYHKPEAASAAKKAFLVTRVGDVLFLVGILVIWNLFHTFRFEEIVVKIPALWVAILVVAWIGAFTALFSASMALANYDIKRVLAFSTISQLAYMFLGLGAGAWLMASHGVEEGTIGYSAGLFHLTNHAFFKALLFLGAGSVIHAVVTNDMRKMGGLRRHMPITAWTMLFGCLALAGIPPFSGFWSKDEVLSVTFHAGGDQSAFYALYALGILTAFLTAFYTFRLWFMTFAGSFRGPREEHLQESPRVMTSPLVVLSAFAVASGLLLLLLVPGTFSNFVYSRASAVENPFKAFARTVDGGLLALSVVVALAGLGLAFAVYYRQRIPAGRATRSPGAGPGD